MHYCLSSASGSLPYLVCLLPDSTGTCWHPAACTARDVPCERGAILGCLLNATRWAQPIETKAICDRKKAVFSRKRAQSIACIFSWSIVWWEPIRRKWIAGQTQL